MKQERLEELTKPELRDLAKKHSINLVVERPFPLKNISATKREDIIKVLASKLTKPKIQKYLREVEENRRKETLETEYKNVLKAVKKTPFIKEKRKEPESYYTKQLFQSLNAQFSGVKIEKIRPGKRFDITVGNKIAIELKIANGNCSRLRTLSHQIDKYSEEFEKVLIVIIDTGARHDLLQEHLRLLRNKDVDPIVRDVKKFM